MTLCHYSECHVLFIVILNVLMLNVVAPISHPSQIFRANLGAYPYVGVLKDSTRVGSNHSSKYQAIFKVNVSDEHPSFLITAVKSFIVPAKKFTFKESQILHLLQPRVSVGVCTIKHFKTQLNIIASQFYLVQHLWLNALAYSKALAYQTSVSPPCTQILDQSRSDKWTSKQFYRINYGSKKLCGTGPRCLLVSVLQTFLKQWENKLDF